LTTQLISINMTPTMNRRSAVVTELHLETQKHTSNRNGSDREIIEI
jgi:hypothetical protein